MEQDGGGMERRDKKQKQLKRSMIRSQPYSLGSSRECWALIAAMVICACMEVAIVMVTSMLIPGKYWSAEELYNN